MDLGSIDTFSMCHRGRLRVPFFVSGFTDSYKANDEGDCKKCCR